MVTLFSVIDTHCHLNLADAFPDPEAAVKAALDAGVEGMVVVGIDRQSNDRAIALAERFPCVWAAVGWHPTSAASFTDGELKHLEESLQHPRVVALGEVGLDCYWHTATQDQQRLCLEAQLEVAKSIRKPNAPALGGSSLPVIFHCRNAYSDLLDMLERDRPERFVLHCFAGSIEDARRAEALGAYLGIDGPVTFKKSHALRGIVAGYRRDRLVLETDAPFLSPEPFRGKPNSPERLVWINRAVGAVLGIDERTCDLLTTDNARELFGLVDRPRM